jgi:hypothetical protein
MRMYTWEIKGSCEYCGYLYKGTITAKDASFPVIKCPSCHRVTDNFEEADDVERLNASEGVTLDYTLSSFETAEQK